MRGSMRRRPSRREGGPGMPHRWGLASEFPLGAVVKCHRQTGLSNRNVCGRDGGVHRHRSSCGLSACPQAAARRRVLMQSVLCVRASLLSVCLVALLRRMRSAWVRASRHGLLSTWSALKGLPSRSHLEVLEVGPAAREF